MDRQIFEEFKKGKTVEEIAKQFSVDETVIRSILKRMARSQ